MKTCEALLIKKTPVGESDIAATLFTKELGKIRAVAKNAASSRKRFGGGLEPFTRLQIEFGETSSGRKILQRSEETENFKDVAKNMVIFLKANCLLEFIDAALTEDETPYKNIFAGALKALSSMSAGRGLSAMLEFQTVSLENLGYGINISRCGGCGRGNFGRGFLILPTGRTLCEKCARGSDEKPMRKINCSDKITDADAAFENINCLNAFFQYQTGMVLKSAKVLENMQR